MTESDEDLSYASVDEDAGDDKPSLPMAEIAEEIVSNALRDLKVAEAESSVEPVTAAAAEGTPGLEKPGEATVSVSAPDLVPPAGNITDVPKSSDAPPVAEHKEPSAALDKLVDDEPTQLGWGWGNISSWGTSVLNTAATSVSTFTNQVGEGFYQVLETVESGLVEPDPEGLIPTDSQSDSVGTSAEPIVSQEMVRHASPETENAAMEQAGDALEAAVETEPKDEGWLSGWGIPISKLSDVVQKTSSVVQQTVHQTTNVSKKVLGGGLDVLETIGRKTYDVLAEGDHGLKKTLEKTRDNQPTLSKTLREAKEQAESRDKEEEAFVESRKSNFGAQFDDFQGLVQLEALESLYATSESKVRGFIEMLPKDAADPLKSELVNIKKIFDTVQTDGDDEDVIEHDFNKLVTDYYGRLNLNASVQKLVTCQSKVRQLLTDSERNLAETESTERKTTKEIHQLAIQSLAEMTSYAIEHWHRVGLQLLVSDSAVPSSFQTIASELAGLTKVLCAELSLESTAFVNCLTVRGKDDSEGPGATEYITGVYLESSNASGYIRNGFHLLLPVLQLTIIKAHPLFKDTKD